MTPVSSPIGRRITPTTLQVVALIAASVVLGYGTIVDHPTPTAVSLVALGITLLLASWALNNQRIAPLNNWHLDFFDASPDGMLLIDENSQKVLRINAAFTEEFGFTAADIIGTVATEFEFWCNKADRDSLFRQLYDKRRDGLTQASKLLRQDGSVAIMDVHLRHVDIKGTRGALLIARDVSERERTLSALLDSQQKFARVFEHSPDCIAISRTADGKILEVNDAFLRISGYSRKQVLGNTFEELGIFPDMDEIISGIEQLMKFGSYRNHEVTVARPDGITVPTVVSATLFEVDGETLAMTIAKDLRELRNTQERLRDTEDRLSKVFENSPTGLLIANQSLTLLHANRFASRLLESTNKELIGQSLNSLVRKGDERNVRDLVDALTHDNETTGELEYPLVNLVGKQVWTRISIVLQRNEETGERTYIVQLTDISAVKDGQRKMARMAHYDTLTDLANRSLFTERVEQFIKRSERTEQIAAILYIDLDQFKRVNDTLGHDAGDQLLRTVAQRLRNCVRREDTVARLGGDEFAILLEDMKTADAAQRVADKILETMAQQLKVIGHELVITPSIGITLFPSDASNASGLLRNADLAMYQAKSRGRNNYQFFAKGMNDRATARLQTESELLNALHNGEFEMFYQPKISLDDLSVVGAEALLRWHHPKRGTLAPDEFISVAEESGAIVEIGRWITQEACRASREFSDYGGRPISIAINLSARQFSDPNLVNDIRRTIEQVGAEPTSIEFEITETMLMNDVERAAKMLERLRNLGIGIAIDDFGTGYSSFNYLKKFPIRTVKIDRSFIMDIPHNADDKAISAAVIAMSQRLNLVTVAEGVETREQLEFLQESGCEFAQGYLFAPALPKSELLPLITPNVSLIGAQQTNLSA